MLSVSVVRGALRPGPVSAALTRLGAYSMEMYLLYEILYIGLGFLCPLLGDGTLYALCAAAVSLLLSMLLRRIAGFISAGKRISRG